MTVADRIRNKRIELGLSQTELAKRAGYSDKTAISKLENAGNDITMKQIRRVANALGTTDVYLMGWQEQVKVMNEELSRQTKPLRDFFETHELTPEIKTLFATHSTKDIRTAARFAEAFLKATPEQQKIALEILQLHQGDS